MPKATTPKRITTQPVTPNNPRLSIEENLSRLHQTIRRCSKCFPRGGNCPVPGTGQAKKGGLFLIGQAPGVREPAAQKNFAWTAGKRLFQWFLSLGMTEEKIRQYAYITAVTKCYPGKAPHGKGDRRPNPEEVAHCAPYLDEALSLLSPSVVVLIGGLAIERILGPHKFSEVIGKNSIKSFLAVLLGLFLFHILRAQVLGLTFRAIRKNWNIALQLIKKAFDSKGCSIIAVIGSIPKRFPVSFPVPWIK